MITLKKIKEKHETAPRFQEKQLPLQLARACCHGA